MTSGSDSLALTLLAKQTFQKVIGITVDHRLALVLYYCIVEVFRIGNLLSSLASHEHTPQSQEKEGLHTAS